ncbi:hypothetical protein QAD02_012749 [Eretmocerus hayati]|uniref:Uncharacterized protein n=1 Tax=Eretmocerus hayati TaxID=131215 RepID=A0ACC2P3E5_9HYME|nr:hypothetical protein QAD02_012749 [Eretmocerus hayati]
MVTLRSARQLVDSQFSEMSSLLGTALEQSYPVVIVIPAGSEKDGERGDEIINDNQDEPPNLVNDTAEERLAVNSDGLQASTNNEDPPGGIVQNPNGDRLYRPLNPIKNIPSNPNQTTQEAVNRRPRPPKLTMENVTEGKKNLDSYKTNGRLKNTVRSELFRLIGKREENRAFENIKAGEKLEKWDIGHDRLETYAQEIEYEFDGEYAGTYFVVPRKERVEMKFAWLEINYKREKTLLEYFHDTEPYRRQLLLVHEIEVHEYLKKFLGLRITETAKKFFTIEFDSLNPGKREFMKKQWPVVRNCIYEELKTRQIKNPQDLVKLELIQQRN